MSSSRHITKGLYYKAGSYNCWCQRCGKKVKAEEIRIEWDQLRVCTRCYEERHPQDMVRGVLDVQAAPMPVPENPDIFVLPATITGVLVADFAIGPEELFDDLSVCHVQLVSGALPTVTEGDVLNGKNLVGVQSPSGGWEVFQYTTASLIAPSTYSLTHLLRARYGTELAMGAPSGSPFIYIGDAGQQAVNFMHGFMQVGDQLMSPVDIAAVRVTGGDINLSWVRRSRIPSIEQDDWGDNFAAPLDSLDERYEVDVLDGPAGAVKRTLRVIGAPALTYTAAEQLTDWGSLPAALTVRVYQTDWQLGRGTYREATLSIT
jgi:hypothetical protein